MPLTTAPIPMKTGLSSMIRVMRTVSSVVGASKPGATIGTSSGAKMAITRLSAASAMTTRLMTLLARRQASASCCACAVAGEDRDQRRGQRPGDDQLEDGVGDAEGGEVRVQLAAGAELGADDQQPHPAQQPAGQRGHGQDQAGVGQHPSRRSGRPIRRRPQVPAAPDAAGGGPSRPSRSPAVARVAGRPERGCADR